MHRENTMVSAVFHSPLEVAAAQVAPSVTPKPAAKRGRPSKAADPVAVVVTQQEVVVEIEQTTPVSVYRT